MLSPLYFCVLGGGPDPLSPSGSAHAAILVTILASVHLTKPIFKFHEFGRVL